MSSLYYMNNTLLIVNPHAGQLKSKTFLYKIVTTLSYYGMLPTVYITKYKGDARNFVIENCNKYDTVICYGGDGTLNETVCGIIESGAKVDLGYIPAGSTNDFASSIGLSLNPDIASKDIALGRKTPIDVGCFNDSRYFAYVASFGAFTKASYSTPQNIKNALGHAAYLFQGALMISEIKPFNLKCTCDDEVIEGSFIFGAIANSTSIAGFKLLDESEVKYDDGLFELLLVRFPENLVQTKQTLDDFILKNFETKNIIMKKGRSFNLEFSHPIDFSLDGEYGDAHLNASISVMDRAINLLKK